MREDGLPRVLIPLRVMGARVVDQRDKARCLQMGIIPELSNRPWRPALQQGQNAGRLGKCGQSKSIRRRWDN
ncbi:hypothetical protein WDV93_07920 [Pantoea ananatis]